MFYEALDCLRRNSDSQVLQYFQDELAVPIKREIIHLSYKMWYTVVAYEIVQALNLPIIEFLIKTTCPVANLKLFT